VARNWAEVDATQAGTWIETLPAGGVKDTALFSFVGGLGQNDPATAVEWAQRISEPKLRDEALARTVQDWLQTDPIMAGAWLNATPLGEGIKERALNPKKK